MPAIWTTRPAGLSRAAYVYHQHRDGIPSLDDLLADPGKTDLAPDSVSPMMTSILDRMTAADEGTLMPIPESLPAIPGTSAIPWWTGVPGLDPDRR